MNALIRIFWTLIALAFMIWVNTHHAGVGKESVKAKNEHKGIGGHRWRPV